MQCSPVGRPHLHRTATIHIIIFTHFNLQLSTRTSTRRNIPSFPTHRIHQGGITISTIPPHICASKTGSGCVPGFSQYTLCVVNGLSDNPFQNSGYLGNISIKKVVVDPYDHQFEDFNTD
ncbi:predicted protein [Sclerotinia sclerotiorum 1980 UF-70]|uniref:Uncharacterized protein n=1 Tax=Sclerotinia sclerotiorum (strain ATCC 18683 / 1980 / Ss-1) TaxID=665079 RepID=A7E5U1_SCLS1|nr:predicted protein [Sclerotinia sclerotiorum 1980 UF-70]EDN91263.1 predicted protein [Sclerotinia sclerotiorum 1980 UF-70]